MSPGLVSRLGDFCRRYGPGRLPGAHRHDIGAGYAFATAAFATTLVFLVPSLLAVWLGSDGISITVLLFAPAALPFVLGGGFLSGLLVWRYTGVSTPGSGALAGVGVTCLTYVFSVLLLVPVLLVAAYGDWFFSVLGAVATALLVGIFVTLLTAPVAIPAGAVTGYLYERTRAEEEQ